MRLTFSGRLACISKMLLPAAVLACAASTQAADTGVDPVPTLVDLAGYRDPRPDYIDGGSTRQLRHNDGEGHVDRSAPVPVFHQAADRKPASTIRLDDDKRVKPGNKGRLAITHLSRGMAEVHDPSRQMSDKTAEVQTQLTGFLGQVDADTTRAGARKGKRKKTANEQKSSKSTREMRDALMSPGKQPNVLFVAIDDLNDWIGALGGHPQAKTPNLDRLISQSVLFTNAHCAAPVCSASRHALLSGLRPSTTGWYSNSSKSLKSYQRVLGDTVPMPTYFQRNGYKTLAAGKIFHKGTSDVNGYPYWDEARPKYSWPAELAARGHGYQGAKGGHFHPFPPDGGAIYQKYQKAVNGQSLCWGALEAADMPPEGMPDEQVAAWAVDRLKQKHDKPFFLAVGFVRPHVPFTAPAEFFDLYPLDEITVPEVPADEMDDIPLWGKAFAYGTLAGGDHYNVLSVGPDYWREMVRAYLACISFADAQAGKVLQALAESAYAENTIVVFWSDHGQHLGEKRHWRKMALWEESTRVPLSVRLPDAIRGGAVCSRSVSLVDIYPTILQLCNLPHVEGLEGTSLLPQLLDPQAERRVPAITTWQYNNHAVRSQNFRYIRYRDGSEELYDHRTDPDEHRNLARDPKLASIRKKLRGYLPKINVIPTSLKNGGTDSYGKKYEMLRSEGVPAWLGNTPQVLDSPRP